MFKSFLSVLTGSIVAFIISVVGDASGHFLFPPPKGIKFSDKKMIAGFMNSVPV